MLQNFLQEALGLSKNNDFQGGLAKVKEAKNIDPNYFETYRVGAFIKATQGDLLGAEEDYQMGLEIAPDNLRLLYYYAQFLLFNLEDVDSALIHAKKVYAQRPHHPYTAFLIARCLNTAQDFANAINIIKSLKENVELDAKNLRIANTELISNYLEIGKSEVTNDIENGINHFKKAFNVFTDCISNSMVDYTMAKNYSVGLLHFVRMLPVVKIEENKDYLKNLILETNTYINLTSDLTEKIILKFQEKFHDDSLNYLIKFESSGQVLFGNVVKPKEFGNFVFISCGSERYYAHRYNFIDFSTSHDWKQLKEGQLVSFEIGENSLGPCAKTIRIVK